VSLSQSVSETVGMFRGVRAPWRSSTRQGIGESNTYEAKLTVGSDALTLSGSANCKGFLQPQPFGLDGVINVLIVKQRLAQLREKSKTLRNVLSLIMWRWDILR